MRAALNTVLFAAGATVIALILGFGAVMAARMIRRDWTGWALTLAGLGYAVPGTVLALALLSPLVAIDEGLNAVSRTVAGVGVGLVVAGSGAAIVIAYVVRFLTIATGSASAGLSRISTRVDDAARTLGQKPGAIMRLIHVPLSRPALGGAALLVFVDCLKELPATLAAAPAQCRDAVDLHLSVRHARQFRGRRARRTADRGGRNRAGDPHGALL